MSRSAKVTLAYVRIFRGLKQKPTMMKLSVLLAVVLCTVSSAFVPASRPRVTFGAVRASTVDYASEVDSIGNYIAVKKLLSDVESKGLLSQVAASGLLSKAQEAGISLSKLEPLLIYAVDNPDILILVEASGPDLLKVLPTIVDLAPPVLPLLAAAVSIPPALLSAAGLGVLGAAAFAVVSIPDTTVAEVAAQTLIVGLALPAAVASFAGAAVLGQLTK